VRFLGSYPRATQPGEHPVPPPAGTSDADFADARAWLTKLRG
jgi:prephenate dehydratase